MGNAALLSVDKHDCMDWWRETVEVFNRALNPKKNHPVYTSIYEYFTTSVVFILQQTPVVFYNTSILHQYFT